MKIYLAARYSRREELCRYRSELEDLGHQVTSRWLHGNHQIDDAGLSAEAAQDERIRFATEDWQDLMDADWCISFTEVPRQSVRFLPSAGDIEEWRSVPGSRIGYQVSNFGRVRNGAGESITGKHGKGYLRVQPDGRDGGCTSVHTLVAALFIGPCPLGHEIDHRDGYKNNNWVGNLEYVTHEENVRRASERMRGGPHAGERNGRAKLTYDDIADIRFRAASGQTKAQIARDFAVSDVLIGKIVREALWPINDRPSRGGANVEFGAALATAKTCVVIGPRENVFHCLPKVMVWPTWSEFIESVTRLQPVANEIRAGWEAAQRP